ncbi:hypothetical protein [Saccharibacillus kuerlensis]|uniref:Copper amine oxidase-like N-terminal domain-containing protein n=1 Tax=Saccharibacillus kuerlensis TaxID=459527 RepID=A0ABQ2KUP1_9BACL|nr:hypothetical protein [Saccharibacillus kuerlensis]GGN93785.1 hypothetical protein GCM10010969_07870 [Saccharibacillus kuerlensis]
MKKTRRLAVSVLVCLSVAAAALTASAAAPIKVYRDGTEVVTEASPRFVEGQVMLPLSLAGELFDQKISYDEKTRLLHVDNRSGLVAKSAAGEIFITGTQHPSGMWDNLRLHKEGTDTDLPGETLGPDSNYPPEFAAANLTGGAESDTVILLTQGYGTGVYLNEAVVYNANLEQIPLEDALVAMLKQFKSSTLPDGTLMIEAGGVSTAIEGDRILTEKASRSGAPGIGSVLRYQVEDGKLTATAGVQVGMAEFIGDLKIEYTYKNGVLQAGTAVFAPYDEYR